MTLEQIRYFVASVEAGSFSGAAKALFVSHSSVSRSVAALEKELGVQLLRRDRRSLRCTPGGEVFLTHGQALLDQAAALRARMGEYRGQKRLRITAVSAYIPKAYELIRQFRAEYPEVALELEQADQNAVAERLLAGDTDLGVSFSYTLPADAALEVLAVEQGRFCALMSPNHPLAERRFLTRADVMREQELLGENPFRDGLARRGQAAEDVQSIILQIKAGSGITVLPEHAAAEFGQGCVLVPILDGIGAYQLLFAWRRENSLEPLRTAVRYFEGRIADHRA